MRVVIGAWDLKLNDGEVLVKMVEVMKIELKAGRKWRLGERLTGKEDVKVQDEVDDQDALGPQ